METKFAGISREVSKELSNSYSFKDWREFNKESQANFAIIPSSIEYYLSEFDNKALSLYLYYCLHANNNTGESWHSTNKCADELDVTVRSINNWNNVLEKLGLIFREPNNHSSMSTFLLPISNYVSLLQNTTLGEYLKKHEDDKIQKRFEGSLKAVINIFQFRKNFETKSFTEPYNCWLLIFERVHKTDSKSFTINKYVLLDKTEIDEDIDIGFEDIDDDIYSNLRDDFSVRNYIRSKGIVLKSGVATHSVIVNSKYDLRAAASENDKRAKNYKLLITLFNDLYGFLDRMGEINHV